MMVKVFHRSNNQAVIGSLWMNIGHMEVMEQVSDNPQVSKLARNYDDDVS